MLRDLFLFVLSLSMLLSCRVNCRIIQLGSLFQDPYYDILKDLSAENPKRFILYRFDKFQRPVEFYRIFLAYFGRILQHEILSKNMNHRGIYLRFLSIK